MSSPRRWRMWALALLMLVAGRPALAASCGFTVRNDAVVGNGTRIAGDVRGITVHLGRRVHLADGTTVSAAHLDLRNAASVFDAASPDVHAGAGAVIRGTRSTTAPATDACAISAPSCGGADVGVGRDDAARTLDARSYGNIVLDDGATLVLAPGAYHFCSVRGGRHAVIRVVDPSATTIEVLGDLRLENGSTLGDVDGAVVAPLVVGGQRVKIGAGGRLAARVTAPAAALLVGRGATMAGSACVARLSTGWNAALDCAETAASSTTTVPTTTSTTTTSSTRTTTSTTSTSATSTSTTVATTSTTTSTSIATGSSTTTSTTSTTAGTASSTTTTIATSTSTTAPTTSSTTASTTTSTTSTTVPGFVTCTGTGVDALITVPYGGDVAALGGVSIDLSYPASVSIPGNGFETEERSTDLTGSGGTLLSVDRDADQDGTDDTLRLVYTLTGGRTFPPGDFASVLFDCVPSAPVAPADLSCVVKSASDAAGNAVSPASVPCVVVSVTLHTP